MRDSDPLEIETDEDAWITIFDGLDAEVSPARLGNQRIELPHGIYTIHCERAGQFTQQTFRFSAPSWHFIHPPPLASPAPIEGAMTTHEYYEHPAQKWSVESTGGPSGFKGSGRLFVLIRAWDEKTHVEGTNLGAGFDLLDASSGLPIAILEDALFAEQDRRFGWAAFSAPLQPGVYFLRYRGATSWAMPLQVFPSRSTQVFILFHHRPLKENIRVFFPPKRSAFDPRSRLTRDADLAITGMAAGNDFPERLREQLHDGIFDEPVLGLIGAHWLLNRPQAKPEVVDRIIANLNRQLPGSADVLALEMLAASRWQRPAPPRATFPPMLTAGLQILLADVDGRIEPGSFLEDILLRLRMGSTWVTWSPEPADDRWVQRILLHDLSVPPEFRDRVSKASSALRLTSGVISRASNNLRRSASEEPARFSMGENAVEVGQPAEWTWRAAVVLDEPFPHVDPKRRVTVPLAGDAGRDIVCHGRKSIVFRSKAGEGGFLVFEDRQLLLMEMDPSGLVGTALPEEKSGSLRFMLFRWNYDQSEIGVGDLGLGTEGPTCRPARPAYALVCSIPAEYGAGFALQSALDRWKLPIRIRDVDDLTPGGLICADLPGSFQFRFQHLLRLSIRNQDGEQTARNRVALNCTASVNGLFRLVISRQSMDEDRLALQVRVFQAPDAPLPVVSIAADPMDGRTEAAWRGATHASLGQAAALAASRELSRRFSSRLWRLSPEPLMECEVDFAGNGDEARALLGHLLDGLFDRAAAAVSGDLAGPPLEEPVTIDVWDAGGGKDAQLELGSSGDITIRPKEKSRASLIAHGLAGRLTRDEPAPLRATLSLTVPQVSPGELEFLIYPLVRRFVLAGAGDPIVASGDLVRGVPPEGANVVLTIDLEWPRDVERSWGLLTAPQTTALASRLKTEMRFWIPILTLPNPEVHHDAELVSLLLVYAALPGAFDWKTDSLSVSLPVIGNVSQWLTSMPGAADRGYSVPACIERAEKSDGFKALLEFEDQIEALLTAGTGLDEVMTLVGEQFGHLVTSEAIQIILFGGGAMQLAGEDMPPATASIALTTLRGEATFPGFGYDLHPDPPLTDVIAQSRLLELRDALKPVRFMKPFFVREENSGQAGFAAGANS